MTTQRYLVMTATLCLTASLTAQNTSPRAPADRPDTSTQTEGTPTTIVGCLVQGRPGMDGKIRDAQDYFVRTPTVTLPPGATVTVGSPGTTSTVTSVGTPAADSFYRVTSLSSDQLRPHVGRRVELQGRLTDNRPGIEGSRATTTQDKDGRATTTVETRIEVAGVLHAATVKVVSASCHDPAR